MYVETAFGAAPPLTASAMSFVAATFWDESIVAFEPSAERTEPPAANASSGQSQVRPSYGAPWNTMPPSPAACR